MSVDRLSVTVPSQLGAALRKLASGRGTTVSTVVKSAIVHELRLAALDQALAGADRRFRPVSEEAVLQSAAELTRASKRAQPKRHAGR